MILQRLAEHYDRLANDPELAGELAKPGYSLQKVSFCVVLRPDGSLQQFQSLVDIDGSRTAPRMLVVPGQSKPSGQAIKPCFLWDNAAYLLGFKPSDPKPERTRESFERFRSEHLELENDIDSPQFSAVCTFLRSWSPELAEKYADNLAEVVSHFGVFRIASEQCFVHEDPAVVSYWARNASEGAAAPTGICLVTGRTGPVARLHEPKIKGVRGTQTSGALLVSFNDEAYESFAKEQSFNAPVSVDATFKYTNALNHLLSRGDRRLQVGDTTVVFWTEQPTTFEEFVSDLFGRAPASAGAAPHEDQQRVEQLRLFLSQLREGYAGDEAFDRENTTRFYVLGLAPNASRLSVRFWVDTTVGEMKARLAQHMSDMEIVGASSDDALPSIRRIVSATGRAEVDNGKRFKGYDTSAISPLLAGAISRAVLTGGPYPQALLVAMLNRLRADGVINHVRVAVIKACIVRNSRLQATSKEVSVALDVNRTDPAYVTGRLFALLEKIQTDSANGDLNATIKDRYFSSASATPGIVFPRLLRLSQHHLARMDTGQKIYYEKQIGDVMGKLNGFDHHLNLEQQGLFAVGYFHQRQDLYTSRKKEGDTE
jgi:CRISPR-associated protein Csd1